MLTWSCGLQLHHRSEPTTEWCRHDVCRVGSQAGPCQIATLAGVIVAYPGLWTLSTDFIVPCTPCKISRPIGPCSLISLSPATHQRCQWSALEKAYPASGVPHASYQKEGELARNHGHPAACLQIGLHRAYRKTCAIQMMIGPQVQHPVEVCITCSWCAAVFMSAPAPDHPDCI